MADAEYVPPGRVRAKGRKVAVRPDPTPVEGPGWRPCWTRKKDRQADAGKKLLDYQDEKWSRYQAMAQARAEDRRTAKEQAKAQALAAKRDGMARSSEELLDGGFIDFLGRVGVRLTPTQLVLCAVSFDGAQPANFAGELRDICTSLFGAVDEIPLDVRRWLTWVIGGRSGKSYLGALAILWRGLVSDLSALAPGEQATGLIVCPDLRLARHTLKYIKGACGLPQVAACLEEISSNSDALVVERHDGKQVAFEALPATAGGGAVRARTLIAAMLDECAFFRDDNFAVNDADIYQAVSPRVTIPGGFTLISSTPWAEAGLLYEEYRDNFGRPSTSLVAHAKTSDMRSDSPVILAEIEHARRKDARNAEREFDANFAAASSGLFFPSDVVAACTDDLEVLPVPRTAKPIIVVDASFSPESADKFGWAVVWGAADRNGTGADGDWRDRRTASVIECGAWDVDRSPRELARRLRDDVCARYGVRSIITDQFSDRAFAELCGDVGLTTETVAWHGGDAADSKAERYRRVRTAMRARQVRLCRSEALAADIRDCRGKLLAGGREQVTVTRTKRGHGDVLSAVILGLSEALLNPGRFPVAEQTEEERAVEHERALFQAAQKRAKQRGLARR